MPTSFEQGKINAEIILKLNELSTGIVQATTKINAFTKNIVQNSQTNSKKMSAAWKAGFLLISVAAIKLSRKVTDAFKNMVNVYADFEQSLANTQSVARASAAELDAMEDAARRVGATTRSTASQAANALYFLASAGFTATEAIAALDGVNALAIATQSDLAKTSETVAVTIRQFGLETSAATDIANTFTAAITNSLATMDKLAKAFEYVGPIAAGLGLTVEETTAALQLLFNKGFSGEKAGRGLRSILVDLADSTSVVNKKLGELNISFNKVNPATNKLAEIMDTLRENGVDAANAAAIFGKVSGVQLASLISIASDAEGGLVALQEAVTDTNRAFEAMEIQMDTLKGSFDKFRNAEEAVKISIDKELDPALTVLVDTATGLLLAVNKLPKPFIAAVAILGVLAAAATTAAVAIVGLQAALASAVIAPVIAAIGAIALPLTLIAGATVAVIAGFEKMEKTQLRNAQDQFKNVTKEVDFTADALENLYTFSNDIIGNLKAINNYKSDRIVTEIESLAKSYELTSEQILAVILSSEKLRKESTNIVIALQAQIEAENELVDAEEKRWLQAFAMTAFEKEARASSLEFYRLRKQQLELDRDQEGILKNLETAFKRANELQQLLGDDFSRNAYLTNIFNNSLKTLVNQGMLAEGEAIQLLQDKWLSLQELFGKVSDDRLTDSEKYQQALDRLNIRLDANEQKDLLAIKNRTEFNKKLEDSEAVLAIINELIDDGFTLQGDALVDLIERYGDLIILGKERLTLLEQYKQKIEDLGKSEADVLRDSRDAVLATIKPYGDLYDTVNTYYNLLIRSAEIQNDKKKIDVAQEYNDKLKLLNGTVLEGIQHEREKALASVDAAKMTNAEYTDALLAINEYYDQLRDNTANEEFRENLFTNIDYILASFSSLSDTVVEIFKYIADSQIAELRRASDELANSVEEGKEGYNTLRDEQVLAAEEARDRELAALGLVADNRREQLADAVQRAKLSGDLLTVQRAEEALARFDILEKYNNAVEKAETEAAEKELANQKQLANDIAQIEYEQGLLTWKAGLLEIALNTAVEMSKVFSNPLAVAAVGLLGLTQTAIAVNAKPKKPPSFNDGGVVPGSSYKGDNVEILANAGELILNKAQQRAIASQLDQNSRPIHITNQVILDGKVVATNSARYYKNGQVKLV